MFKDIVTSIFTNKCLSNSKLDGKENDIIDDTNYVLYHLDNKNVKALFRRGMAFKGLK